MSQLYIFQVPSSDLTSVRSQHIFFIWWKENGVLTNVQKLLKAAIALPAPLSYEMFPTKAYLETSSVQGTLHSYYVNSTHHRQSYE